MARNIENLNIFVKVDDGDVYNFSGKINEQSIIQSAKDVEEILKFNNANATKLQDVYELTVEMMQNMLNYSVDTRKIENNKRESTGTFRVTYISSDRIYILESSNFIESKDKELIEEKVKILEGLDDKELRKFARKKMRASKDNHEKGAGLGFIMMARKTLKPIDIVFENIKNNVKEFKLKLVV